MGIGGLDWRDARHDVLCQESSSGAEPSLRIRSVLVYACGRYGKRAKFDWPMPLVRNHKGTIQLYVAEVNRLSIPYIVSIVQSWADFSCGYYWELHCKKPPSDEYIEEIKHGTRLSDYSGYELDYTEWLNFTPPKH